MTGPKWRTETGIDSSKVIINSIEQKATQPRIEKQLGRGQRCLLPPEDFNFTQLTFGAGVQAFAYVRVADSYPPG